MINTYGIHAMINILIPMAGAGSRFVKEGYSKPKPFIDVNGKPMIIRVLENLKVNDARYKLVARREHLEAEPHLVQSISENFPVEWLTVDQLTEGTASTVLFARELINTDVPLLIANSDQIIDGGLVSFLADAEFRDLDGSILTFIDEERDPKWSFARINSDSLVVEVKEKSPISEFATVGIYYFQAGKLFVDAAIDMIVRNDRVNGEFYTCPVYNYVVSQKKRVGIYNVLKSEMHGIGTPSDLEKYLSEA
jgi:dTDP-glucose pyrophosphorylase